MRYQIDGVPLDSPPAWWAMEGTELPRIGAPRSVATAVPGRNGVIPVAPTSVDAGSLSVRMMVTDGTYDGTGTRSALDANWNRFRATVQRFERLVTITHEVGDGARFTSAHLDGTTEPVLDLSNGTITCSLVFTLQEGVWHDAAEQVAPATDLSALDGGVMPIPDATLRVTPTAQRIVIQDVASGDTLTWEGSPVSGATLIIRPAEFAAAWSTGADATKGLTLPAHGFHLTPDSTGHHALTVQGGVVEVTARRCF